MAARSGALALGTPVLLLLVVAGAAIAFGLITWATNVFVALGVSLAVVGLSRLVLHDGQLPANAMIVLAGGALYLLGTAFPGLTFAAAFEGAETAAATLVRLPWGSGGDSA